MLTAIRTALLSVRNPQFFETELGYQGELLAELRTQLPGVGLPDDAIVQQEYQKRFKAHKINVRPDIIIHVPTPPGGNRKRSNFVVFELNRQSGPTETQEDFDNLDTVLRALKYRAAVFVNIASGQTQAIHYHGTFQDRLHCFAVRLTKGQLSLKHAYWQHGVLREECECIAYQPHVGVGRPVGRRLHARRANARHI